MFIGGCQRDWDQLPEPAVPLIVGIDGVMSMQKTNGREPKDGSR